MKKLILILALFPAIAFAQDDWEYIGKSNDNTTFYNKDIEKKGLGNRVEFWSKTILPNKTVKTKKGTIVKKGGYYIVKYEGDCSEKTLKTIILATYDANGNSKESNTGSYISEPVIPDSMGEALLLNACDKFRD